MNHHAKNSSWCEQLYEAKGAALLLYGRALGLSHAEAEDVLQETFVALMQRPEAPEEPEYYCLRAYRNRALNRHRSLWRRFTRELASQHWFDTADAPDPRETEAMCCLAELPTDQREVIVLKVWHRKTFEEIGRLLDISPNTAAGRYRYGVQKLRTKLAAIPEFESHEQAQPHRESFAFLETARTLPKA